MRLGFIGLGSMGSNMAMALLKAGYQLNVHDLRQDAAEALLAAGALWCDSAVACAEVSDIVLTSLPRPDNVQAVMAGDDGVLARMPEGSLWIDLTTNDATLVKTLAGQAAERGIATVDAPVTGAVDGARRAELTLFAGGTDAALDRAVPVLSHLGRVMRCGRLGSGNVVKLVTNYLWFAHAAIIGEGLMLGHKAGVPLDTLWEAIKNSVGDSFVARHDVQSIFAGHFDPSFTTGLCVKDLRLSLRLAEENGVPVPLGKQVAERFELSMARYGGDSAELHVARLIEEEAGVELRLAGDWPAHWEV